MIQSMTGYGAAQRVLNGVCYALEIRSFNNRYLKLSIKLPDHLQFLETEIEKLLRARLGRGTVLYTLRVRGEGDTDLRPLNVAALQRYVDQMVKVHLPGQVNATIDLAAVALLPGVCESPDLTDEAKRREQEVVTALTGEAVSALAEMRRQEGRTLRSEITRLCDQIRRHAEVIAARAPNVIEEYHDRLKSRVGLLMQTGGFELEAEGLMREVAIYAERCDVTEELARLHSHVDQAVERSDRGEQVGRTLDFIAQEMLREANTIASKSNDTTIAREVVEVKGLIDRLKEQVQNVE